MTLQRIDRELKAGPLGYAGAFWQRHASTITRKALEHIARGPSLIDLDVSAPAARDVEVHNTTFRIIDGDFSVLGSDPEAFAFSTADGVTGLRVDSETGRLGDAASWTGKLNVGGGVAISLPQGHDWCVFRCAQDLMPVVLNSAIGHLIRGIDFLSMQGLVAVRDNPAELWPDGVVTVVRGRRTVQAPNVFTLSGDVGQQTTTWLSEYAKRRQSISAFRRAAAEYCGMTVLTTDDLVLRDDGSGAYVLAKSGLIRIGYAHTPLVVGSVYPAGYVVAGKLDVFTPAWADGKSSVYAEEDAEIHLPGAEGAVFSLDGIFPVKGLTWNSALPVAVTAGSPSPSTGVNYGEWNFSGSPSALTRLNAVQASREDATGMPLSVEFGTLPVFLDFGAYLSQALGSSLLVVSSDCDGLMRDLLREFVTLHHPAGCVALWQQN